MNLEVPSVNLTTSLRLGNSHTHYRLMFDLGGDDYIDDEIEYENKVALERLVTMTPAILDSLQLVRLDHDTSRYPNQERPSRNVLREVYQGQFEGLFTVPWLVIACIKDGEVLVDYEASFRRSDSSLQYVLNQSIRPQFLSEPQGDVAYISYQKLRTRIDGLLTWINIDQWEEQDRYLEPKPKELTLKHRKMIPQPFSRRENEYAMLEGVDLFIGKWHETWGLTDEGEGRRVNSMAVYLQGNWK